MAIYSKCTCRLKAMRLQNQSPRTERDLQKNYLEYLLECINPNDLVVMSYFF